MANMYYDAIYDQVKKTGLICTANEASKLMVNKDRIIEFHDRFV